MGKRYWFSVVEEAVLNVDFKGFRAARIEVYDTQSESPYASYEARALLPEELFDVFYELFDGKETDVMPYIRWDYDE